MVASGSSNYPDSEATTSCTCAETTLPQQLPTMLPYTIHQRSLAPFCGGGAGCTATATAAGSKARATAPPATLQNVALLPYFCEKNAPSNQRGAHCKVEWNFLTGNAQISESSSISDPKCYTEGIACIMSRLYTSLLPDLCSMPTYL